MLEVSNDITDKMIVLLFSSGGFRLEAWDYFIWENVIFFRNSDGTFKGAALLIYRNDPESYWTFVTPEACIILEAYREKWKSDIGAYLRPDDPLIRTVKFPIVRRLNHKGSIGETYHQNGWFVKYLGVRKSVFATFYYLLSHCGIRHRIRSVSWFGDLSYSKLEKEIYLIITNVLHVAGN